MARVRKKTDLLAASLVAVIVFLTFLPTLQNEFVLWDDPNYVSENSHIRSLDLNFFKWAFFDFYASNWHPLTLVSHALDYTIWGLNPLGHHLTNNILHALNTFLVVLLVVRLIATVNSKQYVVSSKQGENPDSPHAVDNSLFTAHYSLVVAGVTGLLFGIHPIHVESVAWVSERKDLLCALFFLLSIMSYVKYVATTALSRETEIHHRGTETQRTANTEIFNSPLSVPLRLSGLFSVHYLSALCFFALALMSKPMAVSLPVVLLILDWYPFERIRSVKTFRDTFMEKLPFIALSAGSSVLTMFAQQSAMKGMEYLPLTTRLFVAVKSLVAYLWKMVLPLNLVPLYPYPTEVSVLAPAYLFSILLVAGITVACVVMAKRKRSLFLSAWGYYVVTLLPVLGIVQVGGQAMADRYTYLPSLAPFLLTGLFAGRIAGRITASHAGFPILKFLSFTATVLVFVSLAYLTFRQIGVWKNSLDFWNYVISKENGIYIAYNNRGFVLRERGEFDKALRDYSMAIDLNPSNHDVYNSRGIVYEKMGQFDRALEDFDRALALSSSYYDAYNSRGLIYEKMGRLDSAIEEYKKAISLNPGYYEALNNLGVAYAKTGKIELAIATLTRAIEADPNKSQAYSNIALAYSIANQPARALENYIKAIEFDPKDSKSYHGLGTLYMKLGRIDDALAAYEKFVELSPDDAEAYRNRGNAYAAKGDFSRAGADFRKACSLGNQETCNYLQDPRFR